MSAAVSLAATCTDEHEGPIDQLADGGWYCMACGRRAVARTDDVRPSWIAKMLEDAEDHGERLELRLRLETLRTAIAGGTPGLRVTEKGHALIQAIDEAVAMYHVPAGDVFAKNERAQASFIYLLETCPEFIEFVRVP